MPQLTWNGEPFRYSRPTPLAALLERTSPNFFQECRLPPDPLIDRAHRHVVQAFDMADLIHFIIADVDFDAADKDVIDAAERVIGPARVLQEHLAVGEGGAEWRQMAPRFASAAKGQESWLSEPEESPELGEFSARNSLSAHHACMSYASSVLQDLEDFNRDTLIWNFKPLRSRWRQLQALAIPRFEASQRFIGLQTFPAPTSVVSAAADRLIQEAAMAANSRLIDDLRQLVPPSSSNVDAENATPPIDPTETPVDALSENAVKVLMCLGEYGGQVLYVHQIAAYVELHRDTVSPALDELKQKGFAGPLPGKKKGAAIYGDGKIVYERLKNSSFPQKFHTKAAQR